MRTIPIRLETYVRPLLVAAFCMALQPVRPAGAAEPGYTPTTKDMVSVKASIHRYLEGLDKHDNKLMASAFAEDCILTLIDNGQVLVRVQGRDKIAKGGLMGDHPPPGFKGPPPGAPLPPPGAAGKGMPPPAAGAPPPGAMMGDIWHFTANDYFHFESPTRATHYGYWMDLHPGSDRRSWVGIPGHYEDVLVKRDGQWLILDRKIFVGTK
jgi:hypothetical protein